MNIANWRTTIFGSGFLLAAYLNQNPDTLSALFDTALAKRITGAAGLIAGFAAFANAKDRQVSGNGTVSNPQKIAQADGSNKVLAPLVAALLIPAFALGLAGCAGSKADRDFRSKVKDVKVNTTGSYDPVTKGIQGGINTQFDLRDPSKDGATAKPPASSFILHPSSFPLALPVLYTPDGLPIRPFSDSPIFRYPDSFPLTPPRFRSRVELRDLPDGSVFDRLLV